MTALNNQTQDVANDFAKYAFYKFKETPGTLEEFSRLRSTLSSSQKKSFDTFEQTFYSKFVSGKNQENLQNFVGKFNIAVSNFSFFGLVPDERITNNVAEIWWVHISPYWSRTRKASVIKDLELEDQSKVVAYYIAFKAIDYVAINEILEQHTDVDRLQKGFSDFDKNLVSKLVASPLAPTKAMIYSITTPLRNPNTDGYPVLNKNLESTAVKATAAPPVPAPPVTKPTPTLAAETAAAPAPTPTLAAETAAAPAPTPTLAAETAAAPALAAKPKTTAAPPVPIPVPEITPAPAQAPTPTPAASTPATLQRAAIFEAQRVTNPTLVPMSTAAVAASSMTLVDPGTNAKVDFSDNPKIVYAPPRLASEADLGTIDVGLLGDTYICGLSSKLKHTWVLLPSCLQKFAYALIFKTENILKPRPAEVKKSKTNLRKMFLDF
jgi:hypothetical protein